MNQFARTEYLLGSENMDKLAKSKILVFGVGGVGGYACEALTRSGVGQIDVVDHDTFSLTNLNRQILATHATIGRSKVEVAKERMLDINPEIKCQAYELFYNDETRDTWKFEDYDYVIDAIDTVSAKLDIIERCHHLNVPIISSMGAGNKLNPLDFAVADISKTSYDPLAKVVRRELKKRHIYHLKCVYSKEQREPLAKEAISAAEIAASGKRSVPGSSAFAPSTVGLIIASEIVKDLCGVK